MFTIKYRSYQLSKLQDSNGPYFDEIEQLSGPYAHICKDIKNNAPIIYAHENLESPATCTFGPVVYDEDATHPPRPTVFVMNERGATVASYRL